MKHYLQRICVRVYPDWFNHNISDCCKSGFGEKQTGLYFIIMLYMHLVIHSFSVPA